AGGPSADVADDAVRPAVAWREGRRSRGRPGHRGPRTRTARRAEQGRTCPEVGRMWAIARCRFRLAGAGVGGRLDASAVPPVRGGRLVLAGLRREALRPTATRLPLRPRPG